MIDKESCKVDVSFRPKKIMKEGTPSDAMEMSVRLTFKQKDPPGDKK